MKKYILLLLCLTAVSPIYAQVLGHQPLIGQHRAASEPGLFRDMAVHSSAHRLLESKGISLPHHAGDSR